MRAWIPLIISLIGVVLALGYNWRRVDEVALAVDSQSRTLASFGNVYVRQDVHSMQLTDINRQLSDIKALLQSSRGTEYGRRFDK